jgi:Tol biopolymer transport system component
MGMLGLLACGCGAGPPVDPRQELVQVRLLDLDQMRREGKEAVVVSGTGGYLAFRRVSGSDQTLAIQDTNGEVRELARDAVGFEDVYPTTVSPDGEWIAFQGLRRGALEYELAVIRRDGTAMRTLLTHAGGDSPFAWVQPQAWSPSGSTLAVTLSLEGGTNRLGLVSREDGSITTLREFDWRSPSGVAFSPDGRSIAYAFPSDATERVRDIYVLNLADGRETRITQDSSVKTLIGWSGADGSIYFEVEAFENGRSVSSIWKLPTREDRPNQPPTLVRGGLLGNAEIQLDGQRLLFTQSPSRSGSYMVVNVDFASGGVVSPPSLFAWSEFGFGEMRGIWTADGREYAFTRPSQGRRWGWELVLQAATGGDHRVVPLGLDQVNELVQVDDRTLVLRGVGNQEQLEMVQVDLPTGRLSPVLDPAVVELLQGPPLYLQYPRFSPDRSVKYMALARDGAYEILAREVATGVERVIHRNDNFIPAFNPFPSPDGRHLAFLVYYNDPNGLGPSSCPNGVACSYNELHVIPETGGATRLLHTGWIGGNSVDWTADGGTLLFASNGERDANGQGLSVELWKVGVDGAGKAMLLTRRGPGLRPSLHPDGKRVVFREIDEVEQVEVLWALEGIVGPDARVR